MNKREHKTVSCLQEVHWKLKDAAGLKCSCGKRALSGGTDPKKVKGLCPCHRNRIQKV